MVFDDEDSHTRSFGAARARTVCEESLNAAVPRPQPRFTNAPYRRRVLRSLSFALALALAPAVSTAAAPDARDLPLIDQRGGSFTLRTLHRPAAVIFVDTRCGDACPIAEALFARLDAALRAHRIDATLLTIPLDPGVDSPLRMAGASRRFGARAPGWRWASGRPADVRALLDAFGVERVDLRFHGAFCYLLDRRGLPARIVPIAPDATAPLVAMLEALR